MGISSYLVLNLKFMNNSVNTTVYRLEESLIVDLEYIEGLFLWLEAKIYSLDCYERYNINIIEVHYIIALKN